MADVRQEDILQIPGDAGLAVGLDHAAETGVVTASLLERVAKFVQEHPETLTTVAVMLPWGKLVDAPETQPVWWRVGILPGLRVETMIVSTVEISTTARPRGGRVYRQIASVRTWSWYFSREPGVPQGAFMTAELAMSAADRHLRSLGMGLLEAPPTTLQPPSRREPEDEPVTAVVRPRGPDPDVDGDELEGLDAEPSAFDDAIGVVVRTESGMEPVMWSAPARCSVCQGRGEIAGGEQRWACLSCGGTGRRPGSPGVPVVPSTPVERVFARHLWGEELGRSGRNLSVRRCDRCGMVREGVPGANNWRYYVSYPLSRGETPRVRAPVAGRCTPPVE